MIELLSGFPDHVLAVKATGTVSAEDYQQVLVPAALAKMKAHKQVDLFCHVAPGAVLTPGAMWEDTKIGFGHFGAWGRIAVVTDAAWIRDALALFAPFYHHPARAFREAELSAAKAWLLDQ